MSKAAIIKAFNKVGFVLKKNSPAILVGVGVVGTVASTVLACKATTKLEGILDQAKGDVEIIHAAVKDETLEGKYSEEDAKKDLVITYTKTGVEIAKLYAPAVILGVASIGCILTSHNILNKRNAALASAYIGLDKAFKEYRGRVVQRYGEDIDTEIRYGIKAKNVTVTEVDEETGKKQKVTKTVYEDDGAHKNASPYARFFDDASREWKDDASSNLFFLTARQSYFNDILNSRGYVFLNDVYDALDIPRTEAGQIVGWVSSEFADLSSLGSDGYISFGIHDIQYEPSRDFVNGYENNVLLDFNVDGPIYNLIDQIEKRKK